mmetsp:Transcript_38563/g.120455  ORF Transcript_38563/g.120455 Transcript_38563/m.120455 type:complete len:245 (-) Transcript_38563:27-761(-)
MPCASGSSPATPAGMFFPLPRLLGPSLAIRAGAPGRMAADACPPAKVVLVDMDGVIADFELQFLQRWREAHPEASWISREDRRAHYVDMDPSGVYDTERSHAVITSPGFYATMPPVPGAVEALREIAAEPGMEVRICTAPFGKGETAARCEEEKRRWVAEYLGDAWLTPERFACVKDKTGTPGDLLVDDKPDPTSHWSFGKGAEPSWRHVVFTAPFNEGLPECAGKPRLSNWADWREVLLPLLS